MKTSGTTLVGVVRDRKVLHSIAVVKHEGEWLGVIFWREDDGSIEFSCPCCMMAGARSELIRLVKEYIGLGTFKKAFFYGNCHSFIDPSDREHFLDTRGSVEEHYRFKKMLKELMKPLLPAIR